MQIRDDQFTDQNRLHATLHIGTCQENGAGTAAEVNRLRSSAIEVTCGRWLNVRYWLLADIPAYVDLCLLSGVKRTFQAEWIYVCL